MVWLLSEWGPLTVSRTAGADGGLPGVLARTWAMAETEAKEPLAHGGPKGESKDLGQDERRVRSDSTGLGSEWKAAPRTQ